MTETSNLTRRQLRQVERGEEPTPLLKNPTYDKLKYAVTIVGPALIVLWTALASIWKLPYGTEVALTLSALVVFGGALMKFSDKSYNNLTDDSSQ